MTRKVYVVVAMAAITLIGACSEPAPESAADAKNRIEAACTSEYSSEGTETVNDCEIRQALKRVEKNEANKERSVDQATGQ